MLRRFNIKDGYFKYFRLFWENILYPGNFKIDFVVVGAQKCGTSSLDRYMREHPELCMPKWKELNYFNNERAFKNNTQPRLRGYYHIKNRMKTYGEVTPCYMYYESTMKRVHEHNPNAKIIAILRNPVSRAYSHWNMEIWRDTETRSFRECIEEEIHQISQGEKKIDRLFSYVHRGLYAEQIKRIYKFFPEEQVLFIKYEEFLDQQLLTLNQIYSFLGVSRLKMLSGRKQRNKISYPEAMKESDKEFLKNFYIPYIEELENILNWNCNNWKK